MVKILFKNIIIFTALLLMAPVLVSAKVPAELTNLITNVQDIMFAIGGAAVVVLFIVAGILFLTAQGEPEKLETARKALIWGAVGTAIIAIAGVLGGIIQKAVTGK